METSIVLNLDYMAPSAVNAIEVGLQKSLGQAKACEHAEGIADITKLLEHVAKYKELRGYH